MAVGTGTCSAGSCTTTKYGYTLGYAPNGVISSGNDTANGNWTYSYDSFNRLVCSSLAANGTCPSSGTPTYSYSYDRFGNRWQQVGPNRMMLTFSGNQNQIDGYCYDAAGNLLDEVTCPTGTNPIHTYKYDAENRLIAVSQGATTYIYDGQGRRVQKNTGSTTESYLFDKDNNPISNWVSNGPSYSEMYIGNWHFETAWVNAAHNASTLYFHYRDWLGTERMRTDVAGNVAETCTSLPFGDGQNCTGSLDVSPMHFTGKERDSESGLDNFGARFYTSTQGRFMTPDLYNSIIIRQGMKAGGLPEAAADNFFDGFLDDPQNWNKYTYALNNPLRFVDPTGAAPQDGHHLIPQRGNLGAIGRDFADKIKTGSLSGNAYPNQPGFNELHRAYNDAVKELLNEAVEREGLSTEEWSIQQWKDFANSVLESEEPAIKNFLEELEENNPGAKAALVSSIATYRVSTSLFLRVVGQVFVTRAVSFFRILILCVNCDTPPRERVNVRMLPPPA
jgi:RHS repeat-associated protein